MPAPTAQDERVEVRALKGEYQFGFTILISRCFGPKRLDREIVEQISEIKKEPKWMRDYRLRALIFSSRSHCRPGAVTSQHRF
jgi:Fe-S cluster assembly protein SufB